LHGATLFDLENTSNVWTARFDGTPSVGSIMRARKAAYAMGAQFRQEHNKQPIKELRNQGHAGTDLPSFFPQG
jgi:hypothetical protein